jgi:hypothetical protein
MSSRAASRVRRLVAAITGLCLCALIVPAISAASPARPAASAQGTSKPPPPVQPAHLPAEPDVVGHDWTPPAPAAGPSARVSMSTAHAWWPSASSNLVRLQAGGHAAGAAGSAGLMVSVPGSVVSVGVTASGTSVPGSGVASAPEPPTSLRVQVGSHAQATSLGMSGLVVGLTRADGGRSAASVDVSLSYARMAANYGGDWGSRLYLVQLPACALSTPAVAACHRPEAVKSVNDARHKVIRATVTLSTSSSDGSYTANSQPSTAIALTSSANGSQGNFKATSLNPAGSWTAGGSSGDFTYSYPITVPPAVAGKAPSVALSYDSQSIDGETAAQNTQASWIGDGWSYSPGFIETSYAPCQQDAATPSDSENEIPYSGDECFGGWNATLSLNGHSTPLVLTSAPSDASAPGTMSWRLQGDDGSQVQEISGDSRVSNGLWNNQYWKLTTLDGTQYFFGLNNLIGSTGKDVATNSAWGVPVYSPNSGDPCHSQSWCYMGYRWNLAYVIDPHQNLQTYMYQAQTNYYDMGGGQNAHNNQPGTLEPYTRGGQLTQITYGYQVADSLAGTAAAEMVKFIPADRCFASSCDPIASNAANWKDVPYDQNCNQGASTTQGVSGACTKVAVHVVLAGDVGGDVRLDRSLVCV